MGIVFPSFVAYVVGCRGLYRAVERHSPTERQPNYTILCQENRTELPCWTQSESIGIVSS